MGLFLACQKVDLLGLVAGRNQASGIGKADPLEGSRTENQERVVERSALSASSSLSLDTRACPTEFKGLHLVTKNKTKQNPASVIPTPLALLFFSFSIAFTF